MCDNIGGSLLIVTNNTIDALNKHVNSDGTLAGSWYVEGHIIWASSETNSAFEVRTWADSSIISYPHPWTRGAFSHYGGPGNIVEDCVTFGIAQAQFGFNDVNCNNSYAISIGVACGVQQRRMNCISKEGWTLAEVAADNRCVYLDARVENSFSYFSTALTTCNSIGGVRLIPTNATIDVLEKGKSSGQIQPVVSKWLVDGFLSTQSIDKVLLHGTSKNVASTYEKLWGDGQPSQYTNTSGTVERCVALEIWGQKFVLNDVDCYGTYTAWAACEMQPANETAALQ
jgi:hypothetical protein